MAKFLSKEKYNISARSIKLEDIYRLDEYKKNLYDYIIYTPKLDKKIIDKIKAEINKIELYINNFFKYNLFLY